MNVLSLQQADVFRLLQSNNTRWLIRAINLLLVIWLASLLASLTWDFVAPPGNSPVEKVELNTLPVVVDPNTQLIRQLPGWHLMGVAAQKKAPVVVNTLIDAPDTRLKLVLHGVFASEESGRAQAIIADPKGEEERYSIGDKLPGNAELSEVYPDRVILQRNGRYETLRLLPDDTSKIRPSRKSAIRPSGQALAAKHEQRIREIRQKIKQAPRTLVQLVRPRPYFGEGGMMLGYSLQPGTEPDLFNEMGFQAGDVVTKVNDVKLDSKEKGMQAMTSIMSGEYVNLMILRDRREQTLNFRVPD